MGGLEEELAAWFLAMTTKEAVDRLSEHSIPSAPVNTVEQAAQDPHLHDREIMVEVPDAIAGSIHVTGKMVKFSRTPMGVGSAPTVGQHTEEVLRQVLGYSPEEVAALEREGVVRLAESSPVASD